ncbi:hypothetical protein KC351_g15763 [Hortaea werneckii]|nr:hypothetical protein KC351_g15763 [Hortaea werneckii]
MSGTKQTATAKTMQGNVTIIGSTARREVEAAQRVFNTPKLLEHILHMFGVSTLFRLEYICKGFRTAIASSVKLLRPMHRIAAPPGDRKLVYTDFGGARTLAVGGISGGEEEDGNSAGMYLATGRPFFNMTIFPDSFPPQLKTSRSFRRTLVMQPPVTKVWVKSLCPGWDKWVNPMALAAAEEDVEDSDGITFGAILETMGRLELISCSLMGCSCKGYCGPRLLIAYSL